MCYELEQYWVQNAQQQRQAEEARRREEERAREQKREKPVAPDGVKDPEPVPV
jgi:hypothetical protein